MKGVQVRCYSGYTYGERPASFTWQGVTYGVRRVDKEWREPRMRCFRVSTDKNESFQLCYNEYEDEWSVLEPGGKELGR